MTRETNHRNRKRPAKKLPALSATELKIRLRYMEETLMAPGVLQKPQRAPKSPPLAIQGPNVLG